jgi:hypothetical protein
MPGEHCRAFSLRHLFYDDNAAIHFLVPRPAKVVTQKVIGSNFLRGETHLESLTWGQIDPDAQVWHLEAVHKIERG